VASVNSSYNTNLHPETLLPWKLSSQDVPNKKQCHNPHLMVTAFQLAQAKGTTFCQISVAVSAFSQNEKYDHAPREKPSNSICIVMENFNSLCVTSGNAKINSVNNLCRNFKVALLCGCKTQVDWQYLTKSHKFNNLFGIGIKSRSIVAHNITERVCVNQVGGCAMMAMNSISPEVQAMGIDGTGLGCWCWLHLGSGIKKMCTVMAYQPSNSGRSAGTTAKDQQSHYFCAHGKMHGLPELSSLNN
jgi:hypothetical protein